jgi:hypothetical protein
MSDTKNRHGIVKFVVENSAKGIVGFIAVGIFSALWLSLGKPHLDDALDALRANWVPIVVGIVCLLVGMAIGHLRSSAKRQAASRDLEAARSERAALKEEEGEFEQRREDTYRQLLDEALPRSALSWLDAVAQPDNWLRNDTLALEQIASGESRLCSSWKDEKLDPLRRNLVESAAALWKAIAPRPSKQPTVMTAGSVSPDWPRQSKAVLQAHRELLASLQI